MASSSPYDHIPDLAGSAGRLEGVRTSSEDSLLFPKVYAGVIDPVTGRILDVPRVALRRVAAFNPGTGLTVITFDTADYDTEGMFDDAVPTLVTARSPGVFTCTASMGWVSNPASYRQLYLVRNGTTAFGMQIVDANTTAGTYLATSWPIKLEIGDTVQPVIGQNTGGPLVADPLYVAFTATFSSSLGSDS